MAKKHNRQGRSTGGPSFISLHRWFMDCAAWRSLSVYSRCLYVEIKRRYNGRNNGGISMSFREAEALLGCSNKPIPAAFRELQSKGFIKCQQRGAFKGVPLATTWILTELPQDEPVKHLTATKEFMGWQPDPSGGGTKKTRPAESVPTARLERAANGGSARLKRADSTPRAGGDGQISAPHSTLKAGTYNLPDTGAVAGAADSQPESREARHAG